MQINPSGYACPAKLPRAGRGGGQRASQERGLSPQPMFPQAVLTPMAHGCPELWHLCWLVVPALLTHSLGSVRQSGSLARARVLLFLCVLAV